MLRLTPLPKLARNSETGGAQGDIIDTIFFTEAEHRPLLQFPVLL